MNLVRANALELFNALQQGDAPGLQRCIARSWNLNKRLDPAPRPPKSSASSASAAPTSPPRSS